MSFFTKEEIDKHARQLIDDMKAKPAAHQAATATATAADKHPYLAAVERLAQRDGITQTEAQRRVRAKQPQLFESFKRSLGIPA